MTEGTPSADRSAVSDSIAKSTEGAPLAPTGMYRRRPTRLTFVSPTPSAGPAFQLAESSPVMPVAVMAGETPVRLGGSLATHAAVPNSVIVPVVHPTALAAACGGETTMSVGAPAAVATRVRDFSTSGPAVGNWRSTPTLVLSFGPPHVRSCRITSSVCGGRGCSNHRLADRMML